MSNILNFADLRPAPKYPLYPGNYVNPDEYLEQYFFKYFVDNILNKNVKLSRKYLPIWWTNLAVDNHNIDIQKYINSLNWNDKWFTVCQLDDGVRYHLPPDTIVFHAGGNSGNGQLVPIPLIASPIPEHLKSSTPKKTNIFASFVGTYTHPVRTEIYNSLKSNNAYYFNTPRNWSQTVSDEALDEFIKITEQSLFCLAPAGYGNSSFRLYQAFELGAIPVYISDRPHWLPWKNELNWDELCVIVNRVDIPHIHDILIKKTLNVDEMLNMKRKITEKYSEYFSLEGTCRQIIKTLTTE
jgi:hypothetical protein